MVAYDGAILDPFMGSATTGLAALAQGKPFTGIEASKHYFEVAKERIVATQKKTVDSVLGLPRGLQVNHLWVAKIASDQRGFPFSRVLYGESTACSNLGDNKYLILSYWYSRPAAVSEIAVKMQSAWRVPLVSL